MASFAYRLLARDGPDAGQVGAAQDESNKDVSLSSLLSTLVPVIIGAAIWLTVFIILRPRFNWKYAPRSGVKTLNKTRYTTSLSKGLFQWIPEFMHIPDYVVLQNQSIDSFLFLRLLKLSVISCIVGMVITWPILFPINATGRNGNKQLNVLNFGNVKNPWRYYAHVFCAYLYFGYLMVLITRESIYYINLRQAYLMSPLNAKKLASRTVLYTAVPEEWLDEAKLRAILGDHVVRMWFPTNTKKLDDLVEERLKVAMKLEAAETKLILAANKERMKAIKDGTASDSATGTSAVDAEGTQLGADRWLTPKQRPTHRLKFLIGKKVDTIEWCRDELARLTPMVEEEQAKHRAGDVEKLNSVFVEFDSLREAQAAYQSLTHHQVSRMAPRYTGMHPTEVIWSNLRIRGWERPIRLAVTIGIVCAVVVFWSVPVVFIGGMSNIQDLAGENGKLKFLSFILKMPQWLLGVVTGLLPVILLSLLMAILPPFLRLMAKLGGAPTEPAVEYTVSNFYFGFQFVQVFLVATLASGAAAVLQDVIDDPTSITQTLSKNIPKASNFYLSWFVLQGLGIVSGTLVGIAGLFVTPLLAKLLGKTPRKLFLRWNRMHGLGWGTLYPVYTNLFVIAICYACIAPLVLAFAAIGLFFFWFAYRYNILFVYDTKADTKGLLYPRALQQLFVGLYVAELCMIGLIAPSINTRAGVGPFALMILLIVLTGLYQVSLNAAVTPLLNYLPKTIEAEELSAARGDPDESQKEETRRETKRLSRMSRHSSTMSPATTPAAMTDKSGADRGHDSSESPTTPLKPEDAPPSAGGKPKKPKKPNFLTKFLKPHIYADYKTMRRLVPGLVAADDGTVVVDESAVRHVVSVDGVLVRDAYLPPSVWDEVPRLIIPRDPAGVSGVEVRASGKVVPITDAGAVIDEKGHIVLDDEAMGELWFREKGQRMKFEA